MIEEICIDKALYLPAPDVEALAEGRIVAAVPKVSIEKGWIFALFPNYPFIDSLSVEKQYLPSLLPAAKSALAQLESTTIKIKTWASCESCILVHEIEQLNILSQLTTWSPIALKNALQKRQHLFLACLRVYQLPVPIEVPTSLVNSEKVGKFVSLSSLGLSKHIPIPLKVDIISPALSDGMFNQRRQQLVEHKLPSHPELERLHNAVAQLAVTNPNAKELEQDIKVFLEWADHLPVNKPKCDLDWIRTIVALGNRSKELDEGKNNYQAGTDFENIVHRSLKFLGFTVDEAHQGGSGGLDLFCSKPYSLVGECKAGKKIPSGTTQQLIRLGGMHLDMDQFLASAKLIIGPGKPSPDVLTAAAQWKVSIINPMSLQKLVELKAKYPGSIDLIELKKYLEPSQIDHKISEYVDKVLEEIKLRVHVTQVLRRHLEQVKAEDADVNTLFGVYCGSISQQPLSIEDFCKVLIELSSPLTGYLGRRKDVTGSDRFYFLRDMPEVDYENNR